MPSNHDQLLLDVLRAAGHSNAAELASKVLEAREPASTKATSEPAQPAAAPSLTRVPSNDAEQRAEGSYVLNALKHDLRLNDDFSPKRHDEAA